MLSALHARSQTTAFDVTAYKATIEPDIAKRWLKGTVTILFEAVSPGLDSIILDAGLLEIDSVNSANMPCRFEKRNKRLLIGLGKPLDAGAKDSVTIVYHGTPKFGLVFTPKQSQIHTLFTTSQWMPCVDAPEDKAMFFLRLILPDNLRTVANGEMVAQRKWKGKILAEWQETTPQSTYLFGFAAGRFTEAREHHHGTTLRYLSTKKFTQKDLLRLFTTTKDMLDFFVSRSGVKYPDKTYTQVLADGDAEQEMASFTVMNEDYGEEVLEDPKEIWLATHEMAHQWWGNGVTNRYWTHFWLNEGMANFMTAAYYEHHFGKAAYAAQIDGYKKKYEALKIKGQDKPLVFSDWDEPTQEDRILVYNKGAYVIHLLRQKLGEPLFWKGIKTYTQQHWGKTVTTTDLQKSMEEATGKDLGDFFREWVY